LYWRLRGERVVELGRKNPQDLWVISGDHLLRLRADTTRTAAQSHPFLTSPAGKGSKRALPLSVSVETC
jgi:hypothetical protein